MLKLSSGKNTTSKNDITRNKSSNFHLPDGHGNDHSYYLKEVRVHHFHFSKYTGCGIM
jgi:hypothetical protein